jgi:putative membrane protein
MKAFINRWLPSLTLALWSAVLLHFYLSGRISAFLHPVFRPPVLLAGGVLALFALVVAFGRRPGECGDDVCGHSVTRLTGGKVLVFAGLIFPILVTSLASEDSFGLTAIENRAVAFDASALPRARKSAEMPDLPLPPETSLEDGAATMLGQAGKPRIEISVLDLLYAAQEPVFRSEFEGRTVEMVGQLMAEPEANPAGNRMRLVRMMMTCCAADAKPVAVLIEFTDLPQEQELSWVRVVGVPTFIMEGGRTIAVLKAESIQLTDPPDETMLF